MRHTTSPTRCSSGRQDTYSDVDPGTDFTLAETIPGGAPWTLSSIVCSLDETDYVIYANGAPTGATFPVETAETTSCVITNATSYLDVSKLTNPVDTETDFSFTANGSPFVLSGGETSTPFQFAPGTSVTITEADLAGWSLSDIVCTVDGQEVAPTAEDLDAGSVTIATVAGETVNCAFTNDTSFVTVTKQTLPDGSSEVFDFAVNGSPVSLSDGQTSAAFQYEPGTEVTIAETLPDGWDLTDITCTVDGVELDESVTVTTVAGTTIDCTFTNSQDGTIIINKSLVGEDDATFEYTGTWLDPEGFEITTVNGFGTQTFQNIDPDTYTVDELPLEGYDGTMLVCDDSDDNGTASTVVGLVGTINLDPGETVECTYTNTQRARLLVDKETVPDEYDQDFDFVFSNGQFQTPFTLNDSTDDEADPWTSGFIVPGTYTVDETVPDHWTLTDISCGDRDGDGTTITLAAGQVVTCVFTNTAAPAEVTLTKSVEGVDPSLEWSFDFELIEEPGGTPDPRTVDNSALPGSASATWSDLNLGSTYTLIESDVPDGWTVGDILCTGLIDLDAGADGFQFEATPGLDLDCTVDERRLAGRRRRGEDRQRCRRRLRMGVRLHDRSGAGRAGCHADDLGVGPDSDVVSWTDLIPGAHYTIYRGVGARLGAGRDHVRDRGWIAHRSERRRTRVRVRGRGRRLHRLLRDEPGRARRHRRHEVRGRRRRRVRLRAAAARRGGRAGRRPDRDVRDHGRRLRRRDVREPLAGFALLARRGRSGRRLDPGRPHLHRHARRADAPEPLDTSDFTIAAG